MNDRRFTVVRTPEGVEVREDAAGRYLFFVEAFQAAKRMAGWPDETLSVRSLAEEEARRRRGLPLL